MLGPSPDEGTRGRDGRGPRLRASAYLRPATEVGGDHGDQDAFPHLHHFLSRLVGHIRHDHELEDGLKEQAAAWRSRRSRPGSS